MPKPESAVVDQWKAAFGQRLRQLRHDKGLSQMQLAAATGLDPTYISAIEQGRRNLGLVNIHVLAQALDLHASALFPEAPRSAEPGGVDR